MLDKMLMFIAEGVSKHAGTGNVSVPNATTTTLKSLTLDKGLWLIVGHNQWTESFSNPFVLSLAGLPRGDVVNRGTGVNGGGLNVIALEKINQPTTIKLNAYQPSGSAKTSNQIRLDAVKICLGGGTVKVGISMLSAFGRRWRHARQDFKSHSEQTERLNNITCSNTYDRSERRSIMVKIRANSYFHRCYCNNIKLERWNNTGNRISTILCSKCALHNDGQQFFLIVCDRLYQQRRRHRKTPYGSGNIRKPFMENFRSLYFTVMSDWGCASC